MNDRFLEMDKFLKYFARVYIQNPDLEINKDSFYSELTKYDYSNEELVNRSIKDNFERWRAYNQTSDNLRVFWDERQKRFLQFQNPKVRQGKEYKLYLSFPKDKIFKSVNKIFDFIDKNDMPTYSKVADIVRSDSVVLRMTNKDDVAKLLNFINSDYELVSCAKKTNPFLMRNGVVGFGYDDMLSYNSTLCDLFEIYFKDCKKNNTLGNVSLNNFERYADRFYKDVFINGSKTYDFNKRVNMNDRFRNDGIKLVNYEQVFKLINCSLFNDLDIEYYFRTVENFRDVENNNNKAQYYNNILTIEKGLTNDSKNTPRGILKLINVNKKNKNSSVRNILNNYITLAYEKYGSPDLVYKHLYYYMHGKFNAITRDGGFRDVFIEQINPQLLSQVINGDLKSYVFDFISNLEKYNMFCNACVATYEKYGFIQLYHAVINATNGDFNSFTNDDNSRVNLCNNIKNSEIASLCMMFLRNNGCELSKEQDLYFVFCDLIAKSRQNIKDSDYSR